MHHAHIVSSRLFVQSFPALVDWELMVLEPELAIHASSISGRSIDMQICYVWPAELHVNHGAAPFFAWLSTIEPNMLLLIPCWAHVCTQHHHQQQSHNMFVICHNFFLPTYYVGRARAFISASALLKSIIQKCILQNGLLKIKPTETISWQTNNMQLLKKLKPKSLC